jgi:hypothetical protein
VRFIPILGACLATALLVAACGGQGASDSAGSQTAQPQTSTQPPPPPPVSPDKLNPGRYSTKPLAPMGKAGSPQRGALIEAQRMADYTTGPWEVDPSLINSYLDTYYVFTSPAQLAGLGPESIAAAAGKRGMINGFGSARENPDSAALFNAVLHFPDDASATAAATEMNAAAAAQPVSGVQPKPIAIPGHSNTAASTYAYTPSDSDKPRAYVRSYTAHGPFVLTQFAQSAGGEDAAAAMVAKAIDLQVPLIDGFTPAKLDALPDVEVDPTGLLAKTLPLPAEGASVAKGAVYAPRGASHFQSNPVASTTLFKDTGVKHVAMAGANVYESKDNATARFITNAFNDEVTSMEGSTAAAPVPEIPDSHCMAFPKAFYCVAPAANFAIEMRGANFDEVQQQVAAQYIILTTAP